MRRNGNRLSRDERREMMDKLMVVVRERLLDHKRNGIKFNQIAEKIDMPKTRISEVLNLAYVSKKTITRLIQHGFIDVDDIDAADLTETQRRVFDAIMKQP